jgi:hypothetical protein
VFEVLNRWFVRMSEIAAGHHGTIDSFIGDAIMVLFGDPRHGIPSSGKRVPRQERRRRPRGSEDRFPLPAKSVRRKSEAEGHDAEHHLGDEDELLIRGLDERTEDWRRPGSLPVPWEQAAQPFRSRS